VRPANAFLTGQTDIELLRMYILSNPAYAREGQERFASSSKCWCDGPRPASNRISV
jgi:hypothetical protein